MKEERERWAVFLAEIRMRLMEEAMQDLHQDGTTSDVDLVREFFDRTSSMTPSRYVAYAQKNADEAMRKYARSLYLGEYSNKKRLEREARYAVRVWRCIVDMYPEGDCLGESRVLKDELAERRKERQVDRVMQDLHCLEDYSDEHLEIIKRMQLQDAATMTAKVQKAMEFTGNDKPTLAELAAFDEAISNMVRMTVRMHRYLTTAQASRVRKALASIEQTVYLTYLRNL